MRKFLFKFFADCVKMLKYVDVVLNSEQSDASKLLVSDGNLPPVSVAKKRPRQHPRYDDRRRFESSRSPPYYLNLAPGLAVRHTADQRYGMLIKLAGAGFQVIFGVRSINIRYAQSTHPAEHFNKIFYKNKNILKLLTIYCQINLNINATNAEDL